MELIMPSQTKIRQTPRHRCILGTIEHPRIHFRGGAVIAQRSPSRSSTEAGGRDAIGSNRRRNIRTTSVLARVLVQG